MDLEDQAQLDWMFQVRSHPEVSPYFFAPPPVKFSEHVEFLKQSVLSKKREFFIVTREDQMCGYCQVIYNLENLEVGFAIHPDWWGKGVGKASVDLLLSSIPQNKAVVLYVKSDNLRAIRLYQKFGFSIIETEKNRCLMRKI